MMLNLMPLFTPAAILVFLIAVVIAFLVDTHRNKVRQRRSSYPSPDRKRVAKVVELDDEERAISD